jgi:RsiW-degrading membrane proteinase PrsW (M82 family)
MTPLALLLGVLPVLVFLAGMLFLDSYKLVTRGDLLRSVLAGAAAALLAYVANVALLEFLHVDPQTLRRYLAPVIEESFKAALVVYLVRAEKVGFMVDAGIHGFAIGTGFAVIENVYYAWTLGSGSLPLWIARGLGTAVLHGSTTAIVAILSKELTERRSSKRLSLFAPGLALAMGVHSLYNHLLVNPLVATAAMLVGMPLLVFAVYERSEHATREWLGTGLDSDMERLELLVSGEVRESPIGAYLESLRHRFSGPVLADMLCLLRIHLELSMRAKGILIARAAGVEVPPDESLRANLRELDYLEKTIGPTGRLAMHPLLRTSSRDLWQVTMLRR